MERNYRWYIEPDPLTNESIARFLASEGIAQESEAQIRCEDRVLRHVWEVPYRVVTLFKNSTKIFPFKFTVYVQEGDGTPRIFSLHNKKKKLSVEAKKALDKLEEMKAKKGK